MLYIPIKKKKKKNYVIDIHCSHLTTFTIKNRKNIKKLEKLRSKVLGFCKINSNIFTMHSPTTTNPKSTSKHARTHQMTTL